MYRATLKTPYTEKVYGYYESEFKARDEISRNQNRIVEKVIFQQEEDGKIRARLNCDVPHVWTLDYINTSPKNIGRVRIHTFLETVCENPRYLCVDHSHRIWIDHKPHWRNRMIPMEPSKIRDLEYWKSISSLTSDLSLSDHGPISDEYEILPSYTRIAWILVNLDKGNYGHYVLYDSLEQINRQRANNLETTVIDIDGVKSTYPSHRVVEIEMREV